MDFWRRISQRAWLLGVLAGVLLLGVGAGLGQLEAVRTKAVMVCLECIGSG